MSTQPDFVLIRILSTFHHSSFLFALRVPQLHVQLLMSRLLRSWLSSSWFFCWTINDKPGRQPTNQRETPLPLFVCKCRTNCWQTWEMSQNKGIRFRSFCALGVKKSSFLIIQLVQLIVEHINCWTRFKCGTITNLTNITAQLDPIRTASVRLGRHQTGDTDGTSLVNIMLLQQFSEVIKHCVLKCCEE